MSLAHDFQRVLAAPKGEEARTGRTNALTMTAASSLVRAFKPEVMVCFNCGFRPVQAAVTLDDGSKKFCFWCPNEECAANWSSPPNRRWSRSKVEAARAWNLDNTLSPCGRANRGLDTESFRL